MNCSPSLCRADLEPVLGADPGIAAFGVAEAAPVSDHDIAMFDAWTAAGCHAGMDYMTRHSVVRRDPRMLIDSGARSLIVCAIPYAPTRERDRRLPHIARYALGRDYHDVVRARLGAAAECLRQTLGGEWRVCVDTAPLRERYWAVRAGVGFIGLNGQLIVPGVGSYVFIATLLTTLSITPDRPYGNTCFGCRRCLLACPGRALRGDGTVDARRCLSCLTIEHRGEFPEGTDLHNTLYGCDRCQEVCPHNRPHAVTGWPELDATDQMLTLDCDRVASLDADSFRELFRFSAVRRTKLHGLQRNAAVIMAQYKKR